MMNTLRLVELQDVRDDGDDSSAVGCGEDPVVSELRELIWTAMRAERRARASRRRMSEHVANAFKPAGER